MCLYLPILSVYNPPVPTLSACLPPPVNARMRNTNLSDRERKEIKRNGQVGSRRLPEFRLADLVYMLSYHPDFDDEDFEK